MRGLLYLVAVLGLVACAGEEKFRVVRHGIASSSCDCAAEIGGTPVFPSDSYDSCEALAAEHGCEQYDLVDGLRGGCPDCDSVCLIDVCLEPCDCR